MSPTMFLSLPSSSSLFLLLCLLFFLHSPPAATDDPLYQICGNGAYKTNSTHEINGNYTANSTYETNLNLLLPSLVSNASFSGGYYSTMIGQFPNQIYGLALCRGDVNASLCRSCLDTASQDIVSRCPYKIEAIVWYDDCVLHYSNLWSLATTEDLGEIYMWNVNNITTDRPLFEKLVGELLSAITYWAAYNTTMRFATGEAKFTTDFPMIYGLVQCTPDLWPSKCQQCLQDIFDPLQTYFQGRPGARVLAVHCNYRYEVYNFYDGESMVKLGSPIPAPAPLVPPLVEPPAPLVPPPVNPVDEANLEEITDAESLLLDLSMLRTATANFSEENKLGVGGFGAVYKGILPNGQELAAKRLSTTSRQGLAELKNELVLVAKLRHKNLVRLLGVCLEEQEKLLVYEYVPNRSLDTVLFDPIKREQLHWERRHKIIRGIARGLLYLHEDSQLKIIHRDLKAGNILLDADMNPKISDFGLARLFGGDQSQSITTRVVGTFGYMAPEYVMHGQLSVKSDVYSYGVLVLEIITGRKNSSFSNSESGKYLLSYIWEQWNKGTVLEILDPCLGNHCPTTEVLRCIQIGLLCVQENPSDRPDMSTVVMMLNSDPVSILRPSRPAFCIRQNVIGSSDHSNDRLIPVSLNEMSNTELEPR
ncbi:cysteine-rich receptor-like protein kinase 6 isoform X2 [Elaeis guineensis]|uniref:Cysteine-rich receptor-like protein kinase 6 isoform X2 n=1 Tax=Elaeis guineensis var. tenera TaxID=51953 RepID=A0A6I9QQ71_ELAGV|nr:cysteine-rich receptor-like protein kinase 6 isoform X2 [Elaeis guineensis]